MSRYIHDKVNHQLIPVSGYGSRMATSIEDKTLTIHGSYANVEGYNYGKADITDAVELIAPIETELVASRAYSVGKQFVYRGFLYKVTAPIALDAPIVIGTNCVLADSVSEQIEAMKKWNHLATATKATHISVPSNCNEILAITRHGDNDWTASMVIPKEYLTSSIKYLMYGSSTMYCSIYATISELYVNNVKYNGTSATTWTTDYYTR